jgi:hypothetical protein
MLPVWVMAAIWKPPTKTNRRYQRTISSSVLGQWIKTAWNDMSTEVTVREFKK